VNLPNNAWIQNNLEKWHKSEPRYFTNQDTTFRWKWPNLWVGTKHDQYQMCNWFMHWNMLGPSQRECGQKSHLIIFCDGWFRHPTGTRSVHCFITTDAKTTMHWNMKIKVPDNFVGFVFWTGQTLLPGELPNLKLCVFFLRNEPKAGHVNIKMKQLMFLKLLPFQQLA